MSVRYGIPIALLFALLGAISLPSLAAQDCDLRAYVVDKDPKGLNVRSAPDPKASIIAVIPQDENGTIVEVRGSEGSWLRIAYAETIEGKEVFKGSGWVFAEMLGTSTRQQGADHPIYSQASLKSSVLGKIHGEKEVKLKGCSGTFPKIQWKSRVGYLPLDQHCPNPVTTCP